MKSNITIAPNIYVRASVNLQNDDEFIKSVYGYRALNLMKARFSKSYATRFTRTQIEEMKQNVVCRHGKTREHAYGKALVNGKVVWSCRCEHTTCHVYEKCMILPNALRIDRSDFESEEELSLQMDSMNLGKEHTPEDEYGFDVDDCNFEPPHVAIVLPILNDIVTDKEITIHEKPEQITQEVAESEKPAQTAQDIAKPEKSEEIEFAIKAEKFGLENEIDLNKKTLIICENTYEAGYFSTILYKNKVKHRLIRGLNDGCTLNRKIADVFWDYCGDEIEKDAFLMRCSVRTNQSDEDTLKFYKALFKLCGDPGIGDEGGLRAVDLTDTLNETPDLISECVLNMDDPDCAVTVSTLELLSPDDEYDEVMVLENNSETLHSAVEELFGSPPLVIQKETISGWVFSKSALGRPCRVGLDNYKGIPGRHCLNVEIGLWGDVDGKSYLNEQMGDAIRLQLYIAEKIKEGDELTVEKSPDGGWWFFHKGTMLGEFPESIMRELKAIEGFPDDFAGLEGVFVRNIVTCVCERNDASIPARFRESRIWLGLDLAGYARVLM